MEARVTIETRIYSLYCWSPYHPGKPESMKTIMAYGSIKHTPISHVTVKTGLRTTADHAAMRKWL